MASQAISGAGKGAATGYAVGGPWGAVIGAAVGLVGGLQGDKAAKYKRKATAAEQRQIDIQQSIQRRTLIRSIYLARSESVAAAGAQESGGLQSSASQGAISAISTQGISNIKTFDALVAQDIMKNYYLKKAGKYQGYADTISGLIDSVGASGASFGGGGGTKSSSGGNTGGGHESTHSEFPI
jgi:hypothetical protein